MSNDVFFEEKIYIFIFLELRLISLMQKQFALVISGCNFGENNFYIVD